MAGKFIHFEPFSEDMEILQKLGDNPNSDNGLNENELKEKFDEAGIKIKAYLLDTIAQLNALVDGLNQQFEDTGTFLNGGTMMGALNMNGFRMYNLPDPVDPRDAVPKAFATTMDVSAVSLAIESWIENKQTVAVPGILADSDKQAVITVAEPGSLEVYMDNNIRLSDSAEGTLVFECDDIPDSPVMVNVLILTKGA